MCVGYSDGFSFGYVDLQEQQDAKAEILKRPLDTRDVRFGK